MTKFSIHLDLSEEMGEHELAAIRMGRFRICPPNAPGPPETSHGRFRISTQGNICFEISLLN